MKWISYLFTFKVPFYIYKLQTHDSIIENKHKPQEKTIIILYGALNLIQVFSNKEMLPITLLHKNHILDINNNPNKNKSYYKLTALKETYLICFDSNQIYDNDYITKNFLKSYLIYYKLTLKHQQMMNYILIQKNTKHRIIQLIILFSIKFGVMYDEFIKIPFKIRKQDIAIMSGSSMSTINKTFYLLKVNKIIKYSKNQLLFVRNSFLIEFMYLLY